MAKPKTPAKDSDVNAFADDLTAIAARLHEMPCPACGSYLLQGEIVPHSGIRLYCTGLDLSEASDGDERCTFTRVRKFTLSAPVARRTRADLIAISIDRPAAD